jgi:hypothetical protein
LYGSYSVTKNYCKKAGFSKTPFPYRHQRLGRDQYIGRLPRLCFLRAGEKKEALPVCLGAKGLKYS